MQLSPLPNFVDGLQFCPANTKCGMTCKGCQTTHIALCEIRDQCDSDVRPAY